MPTITIEFTDAQWELLKEFYPAQMSGIAKYELEGGEWTVEALASVYKKRIVAEIQAQRRMKAQEAVSENDF